MNPSAVKISATSAIPSSNGTPYHNNVKAPATPQSAAQTAAKLPNAPAVAAQHVAAPSTVGVSLTATPGKISPWLLVAGAVAIYFIFVKKV